MLTTAQKYIASRYEEAVDLRLDLDAVRAYLLAHGIKRTPAAVLSDLNETYGFHGYACRHPAPRKLTYAEVDAQLGKEKRHPSRTDKSNGFFTKRLQDVRRDEMLIELTELQNARIALRIKNIGTHRPDHP
jgi:hypothetical protein